MTSKSKRYCSVPQCKTFGGEGVSIHRFPLRDKNLCKEWQVALRIGKPISTHMSVCSKHFRDEDFEQRPNGEDLDYEIKFRRRLKKGAVPSQNIPIRSFDSKVKERRRITRKTSNIKTESASTSEQEIQENKISEMNSEFNLQSTNLKEDPQPVLRTFVDKATQTDLTGGYNLPEVLDNEYKLKVFTNINYGILSTMESCCKTVAAYNNETMKDLRTKILLVMVKLKLNISFACLALLFGMSPAYTTRIFYSILTLLSTALKPWICWPCKEELLENMPMCFDNFRKTRLVLDSTEIGVDCCKCLKCRLSSYSHYKGRLTVKFLVGMAPSGLITFISKPHGGQMSDEAIFDEENLINKLDPGDAVMVDKGVLIKKECEDHIDNLIRPPFLRKQPQFSKDDAEKTANVARDRAHVEKVIERMKSFSILKDQVAWYLLPYLNDIMTVISATVNILAPVLANDKFSQYEIIDDSNDYNVCADNLEQSDLSTADFDFEEYMIKKLESQLRTF